MSKVDMYKCDGCGVYLDFAPHHVRRHWWRASLFSADLCLNCSDLASRIMDRLGFQVELSKNGLVPTHTIVGRKEDDNAN